MKKRRISIIFVICLALFFGGQLSATAQIVLPDGTVAGLPSALTVMDSDGNAVGDDGVYYFHVENMKPYTPYTKDIQIMNLRDDAAYHIYFYAEPIGRSGEIDLEAQCLCTFTFNGTEVFRGSVSGLSTDGKQICRKIR